MLADHTTFRIGGPCGRFAEATTETELIEAVRAADAAGEAVLVLGGGSNLLVADEGFAGTVVHVATRGLEADGSFCEWDADVAKQGSDPVACGGMLTTVAAGESWDQFTDWCARNDLRGVECLAGIPGLVGSTPIQNVGAYGQEVAHTIWSVRAWDRQERTQKTFANADCRFGYRTSRFKAEPGRYLILEVTFQLLQGDLSLPIRYAELARSLGIDVGDRAPLTQVREAVLSLRRGKGMVLDEADHDTWSAGSFFTNPLLDTDVAVALPADAPRYPQPDGRTKTSAAWLIEHAGFGKGYGTPPATLSTKHALALTNRGGAHASDVVSLAREVRDGVRATFGVTLEPEPVLVGCALG